jgi:hypothetical protein
MPLHHSRDLLHRLMLVEFQTYFGPSHFLDNPHAIVVLLGTVHVLLECQMLLHQDSITT